MSREETMEQPDTGVLSIPNVMLEAAGIPPEEVMSALEEGGYFDE